MFWIAQKLEYLLNCRRDLNTYKLHLEGMPMKVVVENLSIFVVGGVEISLLLELLASLWDFLAIM
jgi:hypothetical protein